MSWKKSLKPVFSPAYFQLQLHRYLWLAYVPLGVFFGFFFLCLVLGLDSLVLAIVLLPYAMIVVPSMAFILFSSLTRKSESSHLLSLPITRTQYFITTYLAGLVLIEVPLFIMSALFAGSALNTGIDIFRFLVAMPMLAVIYYTVAVLGCWLGGNLIVQLMITGVLYLGPLLLYVLIHTCINSLAFGQFNSHISDTIVNLFCPLLAATDYVSYGYWGCWQGHVLIVIFALGLSLYLSQIRPLELSGQNNIFDGVQNCFIRPIFYLSFVYLIFFFCSSSFFDHTHYDNQYYMRLLVLLAGTGILVAFVMNIWFSHDFKALFSWQSLVQAGLMTILACSLFLIPMYQKERHRLQFQDGFVTVEASAYQNISYINASRTFDTDECRNQIEQLLTYFDDHRDYFLKDSWNSMNGLGISVIFYDEDNLLQESQNYYLDTAYLNLDELPLIKQLFVEARERDLNSLAASQDYFQREDGSIYRMEDLKKAIEATFHDQAPDAFLNTIQFDDKVDFKYMNYQKEYDQLYAIYGCSFPNVNFETWMTEIYDAIEPIFTHEEWQEIQKLTEKMSADHDASCFVWDQAEHEKLKGLYLGYIADSVTWQLKEVRSDYIHASVILVVYVMEDTETTTEEVLFTGNTHDLRYNMEFKKENGQWKIYIHELEGVSY